MAQYQCALCKSLQKQLFRNIHKLLPYVFYNIKYLLVISHLGGYPLSLIVTYSISSTYYALVLGKRPWQKRPNLLFYQTLLFRLYLRKSVNNLFIHPQKIRLQNSKLIFLVILRILDLECHGQTCVKVELVMFGLAFINFRKLRSL